MSNYLTGNTVRLFGEFYDWNGDPIEVTTVKVIIYDYKYNQVLQPVTLGASNKTGTGKYFFDFVTSDVPQRYTYEFQGQIDGLPSINRGTFTTKFV